MLTQNVWSDEWNQWQASSRDATAGQPEQVQLIEVEVGHDINTHLQLIWPVAQRFLLAQT